MRGGTPVRGSGFVVGLGLDRATIVTASHVIEGMQQLEVIFAVASTERFTADAILGIETDNPNGLAALQVRGALPAGIIALSFEVASRPHLGEELFLLGFPQMELTPRAIRRVLSARSGTLLLIDQEIGEGFSGGPVLQGGKVVGVVTDTDGQTTYAVNSVVAREALEGWGVKLAAQSFTPMTSTDSQIKPAPPALKMCVPGEERSFASIVFVRICSGTFTMGSAENDSRADGDEKPAHQVTLSEFWIGKTEITNEQYRRFRPRHTGDAKLPAIGVSWDDAKAACKHFGGYLPTEAQWEHAARAGSQTPWSFGADEKMLGEYAWYLENSGFAPHPVGTKKPNAWGLHDMHGNAQEWVTDRYGLSYPSGPQTDPTGPKIGEERVLRGGSFAISPGNLRSAKRTKSEPGFQGWVIGFRCAHVAPRQP
jgi:hypothetical protein